MARSPKSDATLAKYDVKSQPQFGAIKGVEGSSDAPSLASKSKHNAQSGQYNIPNSEFAKQTHSDEHPGVLSLSAQTQGTFLSQNEEPIKQGGF